MRILHIQFAGPFGEDLGYQENILPKYHVKLGHEVYMLTSCFGRINGILNYIPPEKKVLSNGVILERMPFVNLGSPFLTNKLRIVKGIKRKIEEINPDFIMLHDIQSFADIGICHFLRHHTSVRMIVDCHTDFANSGKNWVSRNILHKIIWRFMAHLLDPYTETFYGVLPARVDFLKDVYRLNPEKCDLLVMGADDELVEKTQLSKAGLTIRQKFGISGDDFLIVTGGKTKYYRTETLNLMEAINSLNISNVKLLVFGSVSDEYKESFNELCQDPHIIFAGWVDSTETYDYFDAADLIVFPGLHSVMWEQAVAMGKACIFRDIDGFHHVDLGGNAVFIKDVSSKGLQSAILSVLGDKHLYAEMKKNAERGKKIFSYKEIAIRSLEKRW